MHRIECNRTSRRRALRAVPVAAAVLALLAPGAAGQSFLDAPDDGSRWGDDGELLFQDRILEREHDAGKPLIKYDGRYIVVHLAENRVFLFDGGTALWSAPAGTGTGFKLETSRHRWKFTTPVGLMKVRRMEKDPIWEAPDWHWEEKGLTPPPRDHPSRKIPGAMGNTAIYLGDGIAIHGTSRPELLLHPDPEERRVSHGCIRLTDEHARELMHMVEVGTPVLIY